MSNAFPRTLRSMEAEAFQRPLWALFLIVIVLMAWASWFYLGHLSIYEVSSEAYIESFEGSTQRLVADFPPIIALDRIRPGQSAWLRIDQYPVIPVTVVSIDPNIYDGHMHVIFALQPDAELLLKPGLKGSVEVEVERLSPAALLLQVAKQWLGENSDSNHIHLDHSH